MFFQLQIFFLIIADIFEITWVEYKVCMYVNIKLLALVTFVRQ